MADREATGFSFAVEATDGSARLGRLTTPHGSLETPAFMPVGTLGAVKGLGPEDLERLGATILLANLYHLALRPGIELVERMGGLHAFVGWQRPLLTDSGGYQVFSLPGLRTVDDGGVSFQSVYDGSPMRFTPETVYDMQARLGVDVAMMLDECPPWPVDHDQARQALARTSRWALRAAEHAQSSRRIAGPALFGIVQGSFFSDLRQQAVEQLVELGFDGHAIGGVSVGEGPELGRAVVRQVAPALPAHKPRYLMGVGTPADIAFAVAAGVDLFDCVLPSRNARHGTLFTRDGVLRIKNAQYRDQPGPVEEACDCSTCRRVSRAFLHHLFRTGELSAKVLATVHNLRFYLDFMQRLREALRSGRLAAAMPELTPSP